MSPAIPTSAMVNTAIRRAIRGSSSPRTMSSANTAAATANTNGGARVVRSASFSAAASAAAANAKINKTQFVMPPTAGLARI